MRLRHPVVFSVMFRAGSLSHLQYIDVQTTLKTLFCNGFQIPGMILQGALISETKAPCCVLCDVSCRILESPAIYRCSNNTNSLYMFLRELRWLKATILTYLSISLQYSAIASYKPKTQFFSEVCRVSIFQLLFATSSND